MGKNGKKGARRSHSKYHQKVQARGKAGQLQKPPPEQPALQVTRSKEGNIECPKCHHLMYAAPGRVPCPSCFTALEVGQHSSEKIEEKETSSSYYLRQIHVWD
jgi:hypothetical protein